MKLDVRYAWNGDVALAYQVVGEGPLDLLVIPGYLSNLEYAWHMPEIAAFYERLASFSRLILMDRRGTGLSDRFGIDEAPPLEVTMDDIVAVLDAAGSAKTNLLAFWDGCTSAMMFAATHGDRVSSLSLFSSAASGKGGERVTEWGETYGAGWDEEAWDAFLDEIRTGWGTRAWVVKALRWQSPSLLDRPEDLERWITYTRLSASPSSAVAMLQVYRDTDLRDVVGTIGVPTLVLHRPDDQTESIEDGRWVAEHIPGARFVELTGGDALPWIGDSDRILEEIEAHVTGQTPRPASDRVLSTVLFTDIVGSTQRASEMGDGPWRELISEFESRSHLILERHRGLFDHTTGDGLMARFDGPARSIRCAHELVAMSRELGTEIRAGAHTGEIELTEAGAHGLAVHVAARVASKAGASEVWATSTVKDLTAGSGLSYEDAGEHELKGVPDRWHLYRVVNA